LSGWCRAPRRPAVSGCEDPQFSGAR
jgi:hypothetical protein